MGDDLPLVIDVHDHGLRRHYDIDIRFK